MIFIKILGQRIVSWGDVPFAFIEKQKQEGCDILFGESIENLDIALLKSVGYENLMLKDGKFCKIPNKPDYPSYFDFYLEKWVDERSKSDIALEAFNKRSRLLLSTDWTQLADIPETTRLKWQAYRQALRDITAQKGFPENVTWPTIPE